MRGRANDGTVVVAGSGRLPAIVLNALKRAGTDVRLLALPDFDHVTVPEISAASMSLESFAGWLIRLKSEGYRQIVFAGGARRPRAVSGKGESDHTDAALPDHELPDFLPVPLRH